MAHHPSLRAKAIEWRQNENLTIDQLAERLAVSRTTVYYWVRDIPITRVYRSTPRQRKGNRAMQAAFRRKREAAYLTLNRVRYSVQYHADQNLAELVSFWSTLLDLFPEQINLQRKSNSSGLTGRKWRSRHGVLTVAVGDTLLRARLQGWMDCVKKDWL